MGCCICPCGAGFSDIDLQLIDIEERSIGRVKLDKNADYSSYAHNSTLNFSQPTIYRDPIKQVCVIYNPFSGNGTGNAQFTALKSRLEAAGISISKEIKTQSREHILAIGENEDFSSVDLVILIGGDGTFQEFLSTFMQRSNFGEIPVTLFPGGTGNNLTKSMNITMDSFMKSIESSSFQMLDVNWIEASDWSGPSINTIVYGWAADANGLADTSCCRCCCFKTRYKAAAYCYLCFPYKTHCTVSIHEHECSGNLNAVIIQHNSRFGGDEVPAPFASLDDGLFEMLIIKKDCGINLVPAYIGMNDCGHLSNDLIQYYRGKEMRVDGKGIIAADGNLVGHGPFKVTVREKCLLYCYLNLSNNLDTADVTVEVGGMDVSTY